MSWWTAYFSSDFYVLPRYEDEGLSGKGIRNILKSKEKQKNIY
ncbi:hypothetical protein [Bacillus cereus]